MKADFDITYKNILRKHETTAMDLYGFFDAAEILANKIYKGTFYDNIESFLSNANAFFENQQK